jgi:hypothetical protein
MTADTNETRFCVEALRRSGRDTVTLFYECLTDTVTLLCECFTDTIHVIFQAARTVPE